MSCEQLCFSCFELFCCGTMVKNGITDACSTADCCPLLTIFPRCCPRHATDDVPDMPQMMPRMMPQMMLQTCPRWCPDDAPDMPRWCARHAPVDAPDMPQMMLHMMPQTCPRFYPRHAPDDAPVDAPDILSVSYLISSKRVLFKNIAHDLSALFLALPWCLPWSTFPQTATYCHWLA